MQEQEEGEDDDSWLRLPLSPSFHLSASPCKNTLEAALRVPDVRGVGHKMRP